MNNKENETIASTLRDFVSMVQADEWKRKS